MAKGSIDKRNGRYRARWRDPSGASRSKTFDRKIDAERHLTAVTHAMLSGAYVDPSAGRITFKTYAEDWRARQTWRPKTAELADYCLRRVYPIIGDRPIGAIRQSELQALVRALSDRPLKPSTVQTTLRYVSAVFKAAVLDRVIPSSPAVGVKLPRISRPKVQPLEVAAVEAIAGAMPERYRALVVTAAGSGLRISEALGLTVDRVDFLRRTVTVDRQLGDDGTLVPPKTSASNRIVPVPQFVVDELAAHLARYGEGPNRLIFTTPAGEPVQRTWVAMMFRKAAAGAGHNGATFHDLRHHFASLLIGAGCSIKAVQEALGHANASETLDTYSHLWPSDDDRIRDAVSEAWRAKQGAQRLEGTS